MKWDSIREEKEMTGDLYNVARGSRRISLADKMSAIHLVSTLAILGCTDPITSSKISGCKDYGTLFEVCFLDKSIKVAGQSDAETVANWMLTFGCKKVSIEQIEESES